MSKDGASADYSGESVFDRHESSGDDAAPSPSRTDTKVTRSVHLPLHVLETLNEINDLSRIPVSSIIRDGVELELTINYDDGGPSDLRRRLLKVAKATGLYDRDDKERRDPSRAIRILIKEGTRILARLSEERLDDGRSLLGLLMEQSHKESGGNRSLPGLIASYMSAALANAAAAGAERKSNS